MACGTFQSNPILQCQCDYGGKPMAELSLPRSIGVVVDYDYVKRLMFTKMLRHDDNTEEDRASHRERTKQAIKTARTRLMALDVVGCHDPFLWWTGRPVRGIRETQKHDPSLFDWPETAAAEDGNRLCADVQTFAAL
jgi:hypothetical protein